MSLPRFSINNSIFVNLVSVIIIIIGMIVLFGMNREVFPNVTFDIVSINTVYPGANPLDTEKLVTVPIEKELKEVDGIKEIASSSANGMSLINIKLDPDERDKQKVIRDIQSAVDRVQDLPNEIYEDPIVTEITSKEYPIIEVSLSGKMSEKELQKYADALEDVIEDIKGVARVKKSGYRDREIQVQIDPEKMRDYYVSMDEIENALAGRNISVPAGEINTDTTEYSIRTTGEFTTAGQIGDVIIRANDSGNWLRVKDVATVKDTYKNEDIIYKTWGTRSINLVVSKKESGDAISVVDNIKIKCDEFLKICAENNEDICANELKISYVNDYSFFARRRLNVLKNNAWFGIILVVTCMLVFLRQEIPMKFILGVNIVFLVFLKVMTEIDVTLWVQITGILLYLAVLSYILIKERIVLLTALGLPVAFFTTFIIMGSSGITINLISMFGLIIVLGMIVDDGIIVAENVYRYIEDGMKPREAAVKGSEEVMGAVTTAIATTIASFSPLLFMTGIIGKFIRNIPIVIIVALLASLAEALIILPSHLADFVKLKVDEKGNPSKVSKEMKWFKGLVVGYTRLVKGAIRWKYLVIIGLIFVLVSCGFLAGNVMKFVLFPSAGINYFFIRGEAPIGTPLEKTNELIAPYEELVLKIPAEEMESFVTSVGNIAEDRNDPFSGQVSNLVQVTVYLVPEQDRKRKVEEIIEDLREKSKDFKGFDDVRFDMPEAGPPVGKAVEAKIRGESFEKLDKIAFEFMDYLKGIEGTKDITWDHKPGKEEIRVSVDHNKAALAGLSIQSIAKTIRAVFEGNIATKIKPVKAEEETDVTVTFPEEISGRMSVFNEIMVQNNSGKLIPLKNVATIETVPGTTTISHLDGKRVVTASCNVDQDKITSMKVNAMLAEKFSDISRNNMGYSVKYAGEQEETKDSLVSLAKAFLFAFLIVYLILASFFKSVIQPLVVMLAIPFGLIGVVIAFLAHGMPFSFMAILGVVGLNGVVVNDSIVFVDFINQLRRSGVSRKNSIIRAGQMRIRPVLLTTITTAGGLSTVAYGIGGKDPFLVPMALSIGWGIVFATVLTLIIIPCIYSIIDDVALKVLHRSSMIKVAKYGNGDLEDSHS